MNGTGTMWLAWDCQSFQILIKALSGGAVSSPALSNVLLLVTAEVGLFAQGRPTAPWPRWDGNPVAASTGFVHAATSCWLHKRLAVNSVMGATSLYLTPLCSALTSDQPMHVNKHPLHAGLAHGKGSAATCLTCIW